jgi:hypothetical protein
MEEININVDKYSDKSKIILITLVLTEIRKDFDISIKVLQQIINNKYFIKIFDFITSNINLNSKININSLITENVNPIVDHCGHFYKICNNGYYKFCNVHKYIHDENINDHQFKQFSLENELIFYSQEEKINEYKNKLQIIFTKLYYIIKHLLIKQSKLVNIDIKTIQSWHKENNNHFRNKKTVQCYIWNNTFNEEVNILNLV